MSKKIKESLSKQPKQVTLNNYQFDFLNAMNNLTQANAGVARAAESLVRGSKLLSSQYLKVLATEEFGFAAEEDLEFGIDLMDESHVLTIKILPKS